ncbi:MAG: MBL fold metallo-hydrolase [Christensenellaceae bacterium]
MRRREKANFTPFAAFDRRELCIDFPPDAYAHSLKFGVDLSAVKYLLTHSHMDHFYAHDFVLRGYKYAEKLSEPLFIFGNGEVARVFAECTRREMRADVRANIQLREVLPFVPFSFGRYTAVALKARHSKAEAAYVYLLEKSGRYYLHLTDTGRLPAETLDFLETYMKARGAAVDLVTFDCTFLFYEAGSESRHMGLPDDEAMKRIPRRGSRTEIPVCDHALFAQ